MIYLLQSVLGPGKSTANGREYKFNCPLCVREGKRPDSKQHLYVNPEKNVFSCHRCGNAGGVRKLLRMLGVKEPDEPPPLAFTEKIIEDFLQGQQDEELLDCEIPITQPLSYAAQEYLKERGITKNQIDLYQIREGTGHLDSRVVVHEHLDGKLICWVGRSFIGAEPKYINAKGPTKRGAVFNLENVKDDSVVITEGVFDAMSAGPNAVAIYGKKISGKQVGRLLARRFKRFYVALDPDAMEYALSLCFRLYSYSSAQIFLVRMPTGKDPSSLGLPGFMTCLNGALVYPKEV